MSAWVQRWCAFGSPAFGSLRVHVSFALGSNLVRIWFTLGVLRQVVRLRGIDYGMIGSRPFLCSSCSSHKDMGTVLRGLWKPHGPLKVELGARAQLKAYCGASCNGEMSVAPWAKPLAPLKPIWPNACARVWCNDTTRASSCGYWAKGSRSQGKA